MAQGEEEEEEGKAADGKRGFFPLVLLEYLYTSILSGHLDYTHDIYFVPMQAFEPHELSRTHDVCCIVSVHDHAYLIRTDINHSLLVHHELMGFQTVQQKTVRSMQPQRETKRLGSHVLI